MRKLGGCSFKLHQQGVCFCRLDHHITAVHSRTDLCAFLGLGVQAFPGIEKKKKKSKGDLEMKPVHGRLSALGQGCSRGDYGGRNGLCHRHTETSVGFSAETTPLRLLGTLCADFRSCRGPARPSGLPQSPLSQVSWRDGPGSSLDR